MCLRDRQTFSTILNPRNLQQRPAMGLAATSKYVDTRLLSQPHLLTCLAVQFLDESNEIRSQYCDTGYFPFSPSPSAPLNGVNQASTPPIPHPLPTEGFTVMSLLNAESPATSQPSIVASPLDHPSCNISPQHHEHHENGTFVHQQPPREPILWPLEHEQEAMLLQHYIENVALFVRY
jgi:hypothetical protein